MEELKNIAVNKVVLRDQVRQYLIESIQNGRYAPGERIVESKLARELGVSQAPVREAIRDLVIMGFLVTEPYKGTSVRTFSAQDLYEVYTVRASLESLAARQAAERITDEHLMVLRGILDKMEESAKQHDMFTTNRLNMEFHETIMRISNNHLLYRIYQGLQLGQWTIFTASRAADRLEDLAVRHEQILQALTSRDPEAAQQAMKEHIEAFGVPPDYSEFPGQISLPMGVQQNPYQIE